MKKEIKWAAAAFAALALITLIFFAVPSLMARAEGEVQEFEISGGILKKYNGSKSVCSLPSGITEIGPEAFKECSLTSVTIPGEVKKIDEQAFYGCKELSRVTLAPGVESLADGAFAGCEGLESVVIPASVKSIGAGVFAGCKSLRSLDISANNNFFYNDGVLYNRKSTELIQYLPGRRGKQFTIPFTVEEVDRYAFWGADELSDIRLSNNIKEITEHSFSGCGGLTNIFIPESVKRVANYAFSDCVNLAYAGIESKDTQVAEKAFEGCFSGLVKEMGVSEGQAKASKADREEIERLREREEALSRNGISENGISSYSLSQNDISGNDISGNFVSVNALSDNSVSVNSSGEAEYSAAVKDGDTAVAVKKNKDNTYNTTFTPRLNKPGDINMSGDSVIGSGRVSGHSVLIIPDK